MLSLLDSTREEPQNIRRGYKWIYKLQLFVRNSDGELVVQPTTGFTVTPLFTQSAARDGTAVSSLTITATTVDAAAGRIDISISQTDTDLLTAGKSYYWHVWVSHATITGGLRELLRTGKVTVPA